MNHGGFFDLPVLLALYGNAKLPELNEGTTGFYPEKARDYAVKAADIVLSNRFPAGVDLAAAKAMLKQTGLTDLFMKMDKAAESLNWDGGDDMSADEISRLEGVYKVIKELAVKADKIIEASYTRLRDWSEVALKRRTSNPDMSKELGNDQALVQALTVSGVRSLLSKIMRLRDVE